MNNIIEETTGNKNTLYTKRYHQSVTTTTECIQCIKLVTCNFRVERREGDCKCLVRTHGPLKIHSKLVFSYSSKLQNNL